MTSLAYRKRQQELELRSNRTTAFVVVGTALLLTLILVEVLL